MKLVRHPRNIARACITRCEVLPSGYEGLVGDDDPSLARGWGVGRCGEVKGRGLSSPKGDCAFPLFVFFCFHPLHGSFFGGILRCEVRFDSRAQYGFAEDRRCVCVISVDCRCVCGCDQFTTAAVFFQSPSNDPPQSHAAPCCKSGSTLSLTSQLLLIVELAGI